MAFQPHLQILGDLPKSVNKVSKSRRLGTSVKDGRYLSLQEVLKNAPRVRLYS